MVIQRTILSLKHAYTGHTSVSPSMLMCIVLGRFFSSGGLALCMFRFVSVIVGSEFDVPESILYISFGLSLKPVGLLHIMKVCAPIPLLLTMFVTGKLEW